MLNALTRWWERARRRAPSPEMLTLFSSGPTDSGATSHAGDGAESAGGVCLLPGALARMWRGPDRLRQKVADDTYVDAVDHPLYEILATLANAETTAYIQAR